jgi:hypothetical protein
MSCKNITMLQEQLSKLYGALQSEVRNSVSLDCLPVLLAMTTTCQAIQRCSENAQAKVEVKGSTGDAFPMEVSTTGTIQSLKMSLAEKIGVPAFKLALIPSSGALDASAFLGTQVVSAITPLPTAFDYIIQEPLGFIPNLKMWLACQGSTDPLVEVVSGRVYKRFCVGWEGRLDEVEAPQFCTELGRQGVCITDRDCLQQSEMEEIESDAITISMWMLLPFNAMEAEYEGDIPAPPMLWLNDNIVVGDRWLGVGDQKCLQAMQKPSPVDFDLTSLPPGWHHVCEVFCPPEVMHYVDGKFVGSMPLPFEIPEKMKWCAHQNIAMKRMHRQGTGQVVVSDICVFASAASAEQVEMLASRT